MSALEICTAGPEALHHALHIHDACYVQTGLYQPIFNVYVSASVAAMASAWDDRDCIWIAKLDGQLVGYVAVCHREDGWAQLRYLYVDPGARGHGLGARLVGAVVEAAQTWAPGIMLWTMEGLESAANIYRSFGWELVEVAPAPWHDALQQQRYALRF